MCPRCWALFLMTEAHNSASSGNANGLTRLASSNASRLSRSSRLCAFPARARTKFGNPGWRQNAARCSPPRRLRAPARKVPTTLIQAWELLICGHMLPRMIGWLDKCFDLAALRDHFLPFVGRSSAGGSSRIANGVRLSSSRFHSSSRRSLTLLARAARASTRLGNPSARQNPARLRPEPMLRHASPFS